VTQPFRNTAGAGSSKRACVRQTLHSAGHAEVT